MFGLFVQWLYTQLLLDKYGQPAYQHQLIRLWVLAKRLSMPNLQNDSINTLREPATTGKLYPDQIAPLRISEYRRMG
jgi:hypothetical protein